MCDNNILVAVKSRPFITREMLENVATQWSIQDRSIFQIDEDSYRVGEPYIFDHVFTEESTNESVYEAVVKPLIISCLAGFNSTIFAYGQTSSGKTHTMTGDHNTQGIMQIAMDRIFQQLSEDTQRRYLISCSYFEIYNERINDLLDKNAKGLKIREDANCITFVNVREEVVTSASQVLDLMALGNRIRKVGCNNLNERSSRSHTIFRFTIESTDNTLEKSPVQVSQLNLVDLAGSERLAQTKAEGRRLQEGVNINKSLSTLGKVIRQLSNSEQFISYRDSKLTRLLQQALGGNSNLLIIATITLAAGEETKSTLEFAQRAKAIKNQPVVNRVDKMAKYESIANSYKEKFSAERQRTIEMEARHQQEKLEREKEVERLKQQCKLVDLFTKGPQGVREKKIPRRHTVGHYGSAPLDTIPESIGSPSTAYKGSKIQPAYESEAAFTLDDEEKMLQLALEQSFLSAESSAAVETVPPMELIPELGQSETTEEGGETTPPHLLRKRIKSLEDSYASLQEFTKLESGYNKNSDSDLVESLLLQIEMLQSDCRDAHTNHELAIDANKRMKAVHEEEQLVLNCELDGYKSENTDLSYRLGQVSAERDMLLADREQELSVQRSIRDDNVLVQTEVQKAEEQALKDRIVALEHENFRLLESQIKNQRAVIQHLEDAVQTEETQPLDESTQAILSKLYKLQDILLDANNDVQGADTQTGNMDDPKYSKIEKTNMHKENCELKKRIQLLELEVESMRMNKSHCIANLEEKLKHVEKTYRTRLSQGHSQLHAASKVIRRLNEKICLETEQNVSLAQEKDTRIQDATMLMELLALTDPTSVVKLTQQQHVLLESYETQLQDYSKQVISNCNAEIDQFVAYVVELKNYSSDKELNEQTDRVISNIKYNIENFLPLLEVFSTYLNNSKNPKYIKTAEHLNNLKRYVREKLGYMSFTDLQIKDLQAKIIKQRQYLVFLNEILQRIDEDKLKNERIEAAAVNSEININKIAELEAIVAELELQLARSEEIDDTKIMDLSVENAALSTEIAELHAKQSELTDLKAAIEAMQLEIQSERIANYELMLQLNAQRSEIMSLVIINTELENRIKDSTAGITRSIETSEESTSELSLPGQICEVDTTFTKSTESLPSQKSSVTELSPKEIRRRKRHSMQDQRRDNQMEDTEDTLYEDIPRPLTEIELRDEIAELTAKITHLTEENSFLENEVQGFMEQLRDTRRYSDEKDAEIDALRKQLQEGRQPKECNKCEGMKKCLKKTESVHRDSMFKIVGLQTKIYDLQNNAIIEKRNRDEEIRSLRFEISKLEEKLKEKLKETPDVKHAEIQCDLLNHEALMVKYTRMKRLAILRREEGNTLRKMLGMEPDQPVD